LSSIALFSYKIILATNEFKGGQDFVVYFVILYENNTLEFVDNSFTNSNTKENNIILCKWPLILWSFTAAS
jgi:hypothetical protein